MSAAFAINTTFIIGMILVIVLGGLGYIRGILGVIFSLFSWVIVFLLLYFLEPVFEDALRNTSLYDTVLAYIKSRADMRLSSEFGGLITSDSPYIGEYIGDAIVKVTDIVFHAIAQIICLLFAVLLMIIVRTVIALINKMPKLGTASRVLGMVFGVLSAYLILCVVFMIAGKLFMTSFGAAVLSDVEENFILKLMYENNPLMRFFA